jgi:hypothetical protein
MARKSRTEQTELEYPGYAFQPLVVCDFIQMKGFFEDWQELGLSDNDLRSLEVAIMTKPKGFPVVPGTDGLRKARFSPRGWRTGKSGALRVGYAYFPKVSVVVLIVAYAKNEQDNLTAKEKKAIRDLIKRLEKQYASGPLA